MTGRWGAVLVALTVAAMGLVGCFGPVERPAADFVWCPDGRQGKLEYSFASTSAPVDGQSIVRAIWDFGDGTPQQEGVGPIGHLFAATGSYPVALTVTDRRGVSGTATRFVDVEPAAFVDPTWQLTLGSPPSVSGTVGNRAAVALREVVIRVRFYDPDGVRLADERLTIRDLEPRERARFNVAATASESRVFYASVGIESFVAACAMGERPSIDD